MCKFIWENPSNCALEDFGNSTWNKFQAVCDGEALTNNFSESFNHSWTASLERRPSLFTIIQGFQRKVSRAEIIMREESLAVGVQGEKSKSRTKHMEQKRLDLQTFVSNFDSHMLKDYMSSIVHMISSDV